MRRFRVAEDSMRPTVAPGDELVVTERAGARVGDVVALPHPHRRDFWLVKRMSAGPGEVVAGHGRLRPGEAWVSSDNPSAGAVDSRVFGPVDTTTLLPRVDRLDPETFREAVELLVGEDPALRGLVEEHGLPRFWSRSQGLATLVWLILEQQVSLESGVAVYRRVVQAADGISPEKLLELGEPGLRRAGATRQKAGYLLGLAEVVRDGELDLTEVAGMDPASARHVLLSLKGVGPWTADVYLLSALRHIDVFPLGDRALQVGVAEALGLEAAPGPADLELVSSPWQPVRAVVARLVWHAYLARRGRTEPGDPLHLHRGGVSA